MTPATTNPSPKLRFQEIKGAIEAHHSLLQAESFQRAEDMALLDYQRKLAVELSNEPPQTKQVVAMANAFKLQGVQEFLSEFRNIAEKVVPPQAPGIARVLNHDVN